MMNKARETSPSLMQMTPPRKIDLSGEKALLGVDVPDSLICPVICRCFWIIRPAGLQMKVRSASRRNPAAPVLPGRKPGVTSLLLQTEASWWPQCVLCGIKAGDGAGIYFCLRAVLPCL
ncbi:portal protein [Escherichia coli]|nr:portal protein [Escherichia coli]